MPTTPDAVREGRIEPDDSLDYFPTQPWAVRALCLFLRDQLGEPLSRMACWEPACGEGFMARTLAEYFREVRSSDVYRYAEGQELLDFVGFFPWKKRDATDWIITNPPFRLAEPFLKRALRLANRGVAFFVRTGFLESEGRSDLFTGENQPAYVVTYCERVVLLKGRLIRTGYPDPFNIDVTTLKPRKASTATGYSLVIWLKDQHDTRHRWITPCRTELERNEDYPAYADQWAALRAMQAEAKGQGELIL